MTAGIRLTELYKLMERMSPQAEAGESAAEHTALVGPGPTC